MDEPRNLLTSIGESARGKAQLELDYSSIVASSSSLLLRCETRPRGEQKKGERRKLFGRGGKFETRNETLGLGVGPRGPLGPDFFLFLYDYYFSVWIFFFWGEGGGGVGANGQTAGRLIAICRRG